MGAEGNISSWCSMSRRLTQSHADISWKCLISRTQNVP